MPPQPVNEDNFTCSYVYDAHWKHAYTACYGDSFTLVTYILNTGGVKRPDIFRFLVNSALPSSG
jgi:hypothetical protein